VQRTTGEEEFSLLGYCMGGTMAMMYGSVFPHAPMRNLVAVAAPVDFSGMGLLRAWADPRFFNVDRLVDTLGNIPADVITASLEFLRPLDRLLGYVRLWDNLWDDGYVYNWRVRYKWVNDQIPFPGEAFRQMTKDLMWENKLMKGELKVGGQSVDLKRVKEPVLNAMAQHDHIAPYEATHELTQLVGSEDKEDVVLKGGHVSLVAGMNAVVRLWPKVNEWLSVRSV
jgi:polyhydroxyalkanoate synthase